MRDSLSRAIYDKLFNWLVFKLNSNIQPEELMENNEKDIKKLGYKTIGILDIFGFENFDLNSLEQLCINFTNVNKKNKKIKSDKSNFISIFYIF
jgi:myosin heavy subunit